jgi:hypothetical protein
MKFIFILIVFSFLLSSCSSPYVVRLEPEAENISHRYGEKLVTQTDGPALVTVSYYDSSPKYVVFHLEVENTGDTAFDFDPVSCLLVGDAGPVQEAIDPEVQLLSMDIQSVKDVRAGEAFLLAGVVVTVAGAAVAATSGVTDSYVYSDAAINTASDLSFALQSNDFEEEVARGVVHPLNGEEPAPNNRFFWLDHALRITTIDPGKSAFGKVAFPRNDVAENLVFKVTVQGQEFSFPFSQKLFRP